MVLFLAGFILHDNVENKPFTLNLTRHNMSSLVSQVSALAERKITANQNIFDV